MDRVGCMEPRALYAPLADIVGRENVSMSEDVLHLYAMDALRPYRGFRGLPRGGFRPDAVVTPTSRGQVVKLVRFAVKAGVPLVPFGGGTGLMGGAVTVKGGVILDMKRMNRIIRISSVDQLAVVQPGVVLEALEAELRRKRLTLGHDPWTRGGATVGGSIATNALGYTGGKYGPMRDQVLALEAVLPDGDVIKTRAASTSSTGLSLKHLFVGTEGTIGVITEATLKVFPAPELLTLHTYRFAAFEEGYRALLKMFAVGVKPASLDLDVERPLSPSKATTTLYLVFEGFREEAEAQARRAARICKEFRGRDLGPEEAREYWDTRHDIAERYLQYLREGRDPSQRLPKGVKYEFIHVSIPPSELPNYKAMCAETLKRRKVRLASCGVWLRPDLFSMVLVKESTDERTAVNSLSDAVDEVLVLAQKLGGSMEYCHGVGLRLAHLMKGEHGHGLKVMRRVKRALDPHGVLNPGKMAL